MSLEKEESVIKCPKCGKMVEKQRVMRRRFVCYECGGYFRVSTRNRIRMVADPGTFEPWFEDMEMSNPLNSAEYIDKLKAVKEKTGLHEAVTVGLAKVFGEPVVLGVCDARFLMGSMGYVVGEKVTRAIEEATKRELPVFIFTCSGGARMQEGIVSLMQMAKTSAAINRHNEAGLLYVPVITDPTTGGVTASFAMLGDVIMAEPGALVGFAGPRVIEQTIGQKLPAGFQSAEFAVEHGMVDGIVRRRDLKKTIYFLIYTHKKRKGYANFTKIKEERFVLNEVLRERETLSPLKTPWQKIKAARNIQRPGGDEYISEIFDVFVESHGDRAFRDDGALIGGIGILEGQPVTVIAEKNGKNLEECRKRNFGMPLPEGYRKALRLMRQAERFNRPVVTFVHTPGAFCGIEAEERGQGEAIARNLCEMAGLKVPVLCILIGEGGSGGALATAVGNEVWMLENATYSVLSPEGYASILWKDSSKAEQASDIMQITAQDLKRLGIIERIVPEFGGADEKSKGAIGKYMKLHIKEFLEKYESSSGEEIAAERYERFRKM